ncbi:MAG TPA: universal stress protein [Polyangiaceae bacterium]|nr:universal stress protein [Polyangiaceae bacterium]
MYIDTTTVRAADRKLEGEVVRLLRAALSPFEAQLERISVNVSATPEGHVCRLHAWASRGRTVIIESCASCSWDAVETATDRLRTAIHRRASIGLVAARQPAPAPEGATDAPRPARNEARDEVDRDSDPRRPRVLLALHDLDPTNACLQWARALARALPADLDVCRVLPNLPAMHDLPPGKIWLESTRRLLAATRETRRWCASALPDAELSERLIPGGADVVREMALRARERDVDWIVMQDRSEGCGEAATALARASGRPVLVARAPTSRSTLLVASDVRGDLYPLSSRAAALAEALHAPVLAFHDVGFFTHELTCRVDALTEAWARVQSDRWRASGQQRLPELEVLLAHGSDRVHTLLEQARREDAEIIIVATEDEDAHRHGPELAAAVVDRAVRSVLVVPSSLEPETTQDQPASKPTRGPLRSYTGVTLERRRWPRGGARAPIGCDRRRWRSR